MLPQALLVHTGVAGARDALTRPQAASAAASLGDGPPGEADIAEDDLGQFIRTPDEIELLDLLRKHLHRGSQCDADDEDQPEA